MTKWGTRSKWLEDCFLASRTEDPDVLDSLSSSDWCDVKRRILYNQNTRPETYKKVILELIPTYPFYCIRDLMDNPNTPIEVFEFYIETDNQEAIHYFAKSVHTPQSILDVLSRYKNPTERINVTINPNTSIDTLKSMLNDEHGEVVFTAEINLKRRGENV